MSPGSPPTQFRIHAKDVGGGFGVRNEIYPEFSALAFAARELDRPVKWVGTRSESLLTDHHGRGATLTGELALDADGNFLALRIGWLVDLGAYCSGAGPFINTAAAPTSMASQRLSHAGGLRLEPAGVHQCCAGCAVSRRRPAERFLSDGAPGGRGRARHRNRPDRTAAAKSPGEGCLSLQDPDRIDLRQRRSGRADGGGTEGC